MKNTFKRTISLLKDTVYVTVNKTFQTIKEL